jgi:hypothetical protein
VEFPAQRSDLLDQPLLDGEMDILKLSGQLKLAGLDLLLDLPQSGADPSSFRRCEDVRRGKHFDMRDAPRDIFPEELLIEIDG